MRPNSFEVLRLMSERNLDIRLAPISQNLVRAQKVKAGTQITIGFAGDVVGAIFAGRFVGGLILADAKQFHAIEAELERGDAT